MRFEGRIVREPTANDSGKMLTIRRRIKQTTESSPRNTPRKTLKGSEEKGIMAAVLRKRSVFQVPDICLRGTGYRFPNRAETDLTSGEPDIPFTAFDMDNWQHQGKKVCG